MRVSGCLYSLFCYLLFTYCGPHFFLFCQEPGLALAFGLLLPTFHVLNITPPTPCGAVHRYSILSKTVPLWKAFPDNLPNVALSLFECRSHLGIAQSHWQNTSLSHCMVSIVIVEIKIYQAINICGKGSGKHDLSNWLLKSNDYKLFTIHLLAAIWQALFSTDIKSVFGNF